MKRNKFILILICLITIFSFSKVKATAITNQYVVNTSLKIYDYANLYTDDEEKELYNTITKIIDKYDTDVAIATIISNPKSTTRQFAEDFYDDNNFGKGSDKEGLILVIDMENREYYIVTTGETMKIINDYRIESILDIMESNMKAGNYYEAASSFLKETKNYYSYHKYGHPLVWIGALVAAIIFAIIRLNIEKKKLKLINDSLEASNYLIDQTIEQQNDDLVNTHTRVYYRSSSSGGGSGGGGGSHGGGGRSF